MPSDRAYKASVLAIALLLSASAACLAQQDSQPLTAQPATPAGPTLTAASYTPLTATPAGPGVSDSSSLPQALTAIPAAIPPQPAARPRKKGDNYTGPDTVIELAGTPMLDEEGKQRLDPDGKPMFNPPVRQQRDKRGHPLFDKEGKPVMQTKDELGYDENGKKLHALKLKEPKLVGVTVSEGTLTVDGMIGKARLNYQIADLKYIYLTAPWIGTAIVSNTMFPGATEQKKAFNGKVLTVTVDDHSIQLNSEQPLLGKKAKPESAFVRVDRTFVLPSRFPVVGYGATLRAPYAWPGSRAVVNTASAQAPPLPAALTPVLLMEACPAGQMRRPAPPVLPGEVAPPQPCVAISSLSLRNASSQKAPTIGNAAYTTPAGTN